MMTKKMLALFSKRDSLMIKLNDLPYEHPLRNTKIELLNAKIQWDQGGSLKTIFPTFKIAKVTYNDLGPSWTASTYWWVNEVQQDNN